MKHSLFFFPPPYSLYFSPSEPLWLPRRHESLSANKGLVVNRGQRHWSGTHLFRRPPDGQLRLAAAKLRRNQLVAIFNYNTWAALALQPRPWEASRYARWRGAGGGSLVPMDEAWLVIWRGVWGCCFVNLLFCSLSNWRSPLKKKKRKKKWSYLPSIEWMTQNAGAPPH